MVFALPFIALLTLAFTSLVRAQHALPSPSHTPSTLRSLDNASASTVRVQLLGFNDFHGQLGSGKLFSERPVGSAPVFASYLRAAIEGFAGETLLIHAGDFVGASPPASGLLQDEPSIAFLNLLANTSCGYRTRMHPRCNVVGTPGNHEFDEGVSELKRLLFGGNASKGPFLDRPYRGSRVPYVSANVVDAQTGRTFLPPYVIKQVDGVRIAVIGAVLAAAPSMVVADGVRGVRFLPEAAAINAAVRQVRKLGVEAIVVTIHQGIGQTPYVGPTDRKVSLPQSELLEIVKQLDDAVDVVISGHAHSFTNAFAQTARGHEVLVTQALSAGKAYATISLTIDRRSGDVLEKSAQIVVTYADEGPGLTPANDVATLVAQAQAKVAERVSRVIGSAPVRVLALPNAAGESALGNLIADAQKESVGAELALMNLGGIRTDLEAGEVSWGELFALHPFGNAVMRMELTGAQLRALLEQQWRSTPANMLQVSGLRYAYDEQRAVGERVVELSINGEPVAPTRTYRVAVNEYLAGGGSGFATFTEGHKRSVGPRDLDALIRWIEQHGGTALGQIEGRIDRRE